MRQPSAQMHACAFQIDLHALTGLALRDHPVCQLLHFKLLGFPDNLAKRAIGQCSCRTIVTKKLFNVLLVHQRIEQFLVELVAT